MSDAREDDLRLEKIKYCYSLYKEKMDAWTGLFCPACKMPIISGEEHNGQLITKCDKGEQDRYIEDIKSFFK